jgi:hypothetical protein
VEEAKEVEEKRDDNTEFTEGRTQRAQRREEEPKTQVRNRTWGTRREDEFSVRRG